MALRKRTMRLLPPVARRLAKLMNELQSVTRKLRPLLGDVQELEFALKQVSLGKEGSRVQSEDSGGLNSADLSDGKESKDRDDRLGESGNRASADGKRKRSRPRNKKRKL